MKKKFSTKRDRKPTKRSKTANDIDLCASPMSGEEESPIRSIFCLKTRENVREFEEKEDCFILGFDPYGCDSDISNQSPINSSSDLWITGEKGQVACRDFPHSRHVCQKFPFDKTPHENCCNLCYCFVCDVAAPCNNWTGTFGHCNAINSNRWKHKRDLLKKRPIQWDKTSLSATNGS